MGLIDRARTDLKIITSNSREFGVPVLFTAPTSETATINCIHTEHHLAFDTDGNRVNSKMASVAVSFDLLDNALYPYRTTKGEVSFKNHTVLLDGTLYVAREWFPDKTVHLLIVILSERE